MKLDGGWRGGEDLRLLVLAGIRRVCCGRTRPDFAGYCFRRRASASVSLFGFGCSRGRESRKGAGGLQLVFTSLRLRRRLVRGTFVLCAFLWHRGMPSLGVPRCRPKPTGLIPLTSRSFTRVWYSTTKTTRKPSDTNPTRVWEDLDMLAAAGPTVHYHIL